MNNIKNIAVFNIQNIIIEGQGRYNNGDFVPCFKNALAALVQNPSLKGNFWRVFIFLLTKIDKNNYIHISKNEIRQQLNISRTGVHDAIRLMEEMHIICAVDISISNTMQYRFNDAILRAINPRIAFVGNTRKINNNLAPRILFQDTDILTGLPFNEIPFE